MPFKIIETYNKQQNTQEYCICPSTWEKHGLLHWPNKSSKRLCEIEYSNPQPNWPKINCIVKRKNIATYEIAENMLREMLDHCTTEQEVTEVFPALSPHRTGTTNQLENIINQALNSSSNQPDEVQGPLYYAAVVENEPTSVVTVKKETASVPVVDFDPLDFNQVDITKNQEAMLNDLALLKDNYKTVLENQRSMLTAIADISSKLDIFISGKYEPQVTKQNYAPQKILHNKQFYLKPIQDIEELSNLETLLNDDNIKDECKMKYSIVCQPGKAENCAYRLIDVFFTREFLTKCSWAGGARGEGTKICMKQFKNVLQLFFDLVYECDHTFTIDANEKFFKVILRNSMQRNCAKMLRLSTSKNRRKQKKLIENSANNNNKSSDKETSNETQNVINKDSYYEDNQEHIPRGEKSSQEKNAQILGSAATKTSDFPRQRNISERSNPEIQFQEPVYNDVPDEPTEEDSDSPDLNEIRRNQVKIYKNQDVILNELAFLKDGYKNVLENQQSMLMAIADISVKMDTVMTRKYEPQITKLHNATNKKSNNRFYLKPIKDIDELSNLEAILNDEKTKEDYKMKYSIVCQPGKAENCAYRLIDWFFSRDFLAKCSWSGSTRGEGTKICLKQYKNVLQLFFELVYECDNTFTITGNENFFKSVLKNALKRKCAKLQRMSTCRNRHKRQRLSENYINNDNESSDEETFDKTQNNINEEYEENQENISEDENYSQKGNTQNVDSVVTEASDRKLQRTIFDRSNRSEQIHFQDPLYDGAANEPSSVADVKNETTPVSIDIESSDFNEIKSNQVEMYLNQEAILNDLASLKDNFKNVLENQHSILIAIADISVKLDTVMTGNLEPPVTKLDNAMKKTRNNPFDLRPIQCIDELYNLEAVLKDDELKAACKKKYSIVCQRGKAENCAYRLIDVLFGREFLTKCSWSGGARGKGTKICMKQFKNVLQLFFELVYECDNTFTIDANEKFFKSVLKNAGKRSHSKLLRTSTSRSVYRRRKPIKNSVNNKNESSDEESFDASENIVNEANEENREE